jgi:hypothetical protein
MNVVPLWTAFLAVIFSSLSQFLIGKDELFLGIFVMLVNVALIVTNVYKIIFEESDK